MENGINDLLIDELRDMLNAEMQLAATLPKMAKAAESEKLKTAFTDHLRETKHHVSRIKKAFQLLKMKPQAKVCKAMKGLVEECNEVLRDHKIKSPVRDAALISKAQRIEHYEIAAYGTICTYAKELSLGDVRDLLHASLNEAGYADQNFTSLAVGGLLTSGINHKALHTISPRAEIGKNVVMVEKHKPASKHASHHRA